MTITATQIRSDGIARRDYGRHFDDAGSPALKTISVGYAPTKVRWVNLTDSIEWEWQHGQANGTTLKTVAAGTRTLNTADVAISVSNGVVTIAAAAILQNKQYVFFIEG